MYNDMQLEFLNFEPGSDMKNLILGVAEKLHLAAPSDSAMKLALKKGKGIVQASCRIASQAGVFMAEAVSDSPVRAALQIEKKIRWQLEDWKQRRFSEEERATVKIEST
jgi:predicted ATP-dependent protease